MATTGGKEGRVTVFADWIVKKKRSFLESFNFKTFKETPQKIVEKVRGPTKKDENVGKYLTI